MITRIARYGKAVAREGKTDELARLLLEAAAELERDPGCELYAISRQVGTPNTIWVTEIWRDQAALDASLERVRDSERTGRVMELVAEFEMIELEPLGGKLPPPADA